MSNFDVLTLVSGWVEEAFQRLSWKDAREALTECIRLAKVVQDPSCPGKLLRVEQLHDSMLFVYDKGNRNESVRRY